MSITVDEANKPTSLTLLDVLRDASPLPWLLTGEQHDDLELAVGRIAGLDTHL